jgi:hopanoid biosynthesis associated protein HpnK
MARYLRRMRDDNSRPAAARRLILSADDFGMSPGVNAGIVRAHRDGVLTEASLMVNGTAFQEAVELARAHPRLGVGLHLVLVQGRATSPPARIPALVDGAGCFRNAPIGSGLRYFFQPGVRDQLRREIAAQLEKFAATGLPLSHVDGHLTIHMHPTVNDLLIELAADFGIRAVRLPRDPLAPALRFDKTHRLRKSFEAAAFGALSRRAAPRLAAAGIRFTDRAIGLHQTGNVCEEYLLYVLGDLPPGVTEIYSHAAVLDEETAAWRPAGYRSDEELRALTSPRVRDAIEAGGIEIIRYRDL